MTMAILEDSGSRVVCSVAQVERLLVRRHPRLMLARSVLGRTHGCRSRLGVLTPWVLGPHGHL